MECIHCKGRMKRGTAPFSLDRNGYHVSWDAIPAWVCMQRGEPFFEAREVDLIQNAFATLTARAQHLSRAPPQHPSHNSSQVPENDQRHVAINFVAHGVLLIVVLMIVFGRIEFRRTNDFTHDRLLEAALEASQPSRFQRCRSRNRRRPRCRPGTIPRNRRWRTREYHGDIGNR
jgi:hypothetical protein